jgi:hypothetical protein
MKYVPSECRDGRECNIPKVFRKLRPLYLRDYDDLAAPSAENSSDVFQQCSFRRSISVCSEVIISIYPE